MSFRRSTSPTATRSLQSFLAAIIGVALVAPVLSACGSSEDATSSPDSSGGTQQVLEPEVSLPVGEPPEVAVSDAGQLPRQVVSYRPSPQEGPASSTSSGATVNTISYRSHSSTDNGDGQIINDRTELQRLTVAARTEPAVNGAVSSSLKVTDFDSDDQARHRQFATADGFTINWNRRPTGVFTEVGLAAPAEATDAARAGVEVIMMTVVESVVVFPENAIGVGATWAATRTVADAVAPTRVDTYRLTALDEETATVSVTTTAPVESDTLTAPATQGENSVSLDVVDYDAGARGDFTVALRSTLPPRGTYSMWVHSTYRDRETHSVSEYHSETELTMSRAD